MAPVSAGARAPSLAPGVELLGEMGGSGYDRPPGLVRRADGQTVQLTPLLYQLLDAVDGERGLPALASELGRRCGKAVEPEDVRFLLEDKLAPLGLLAGEEGSVPAPARMAPLLGLRLKVVVSDPDVTRRVTSPFAALFRPWLVVSVLIGFAAASWWVLWQRGIASGTRQAFESPGLLLLVFLLTVLSAAWHEFGHAAACRAAGATPGAMGAGLYLVWPAFYTDVDDSYRLGRRGRLLVDLGGLYFNAVAAVAAAVVWLIVRQDALLLVVAVQPLLMLRQLAPVVRADGYHILADLTGVPDLFHHIGPTLAGLLPSRWGRPQPLRPWARWVVRGWVLVVVPLLLWMLVLAVLLLPRLAATAWMGFRQHGGALVASGGDADVVGALASGLRLVALVLPLAAVVYQLVRIGRRAGRTVLRRTEGRRAARAAAAGAAVVAAGLLASAWWPQGQYQPVRGDERGTLPGALQLSRPQPARAAGSTGRPRPAYALVPRGGGPVLLLVRAADGSPSAILTDGDRAGVAVPFRAPPPPRPGDNQALAVNTGDGTVVYDVAVALVWVQDGQAVDNRNEAYALASCTGCTAVAIAFQVVLVIGPSSASTPVNLAVALNEGCVQCVTAALAVQLVVTLSQMPSEEVRMRIEEAMPRAEDLEGLADPYQHLQDVQAEILELLSDAGLVDSATLATATTAPVTSTTVATAPAGATSTTGATSTIAASTTSTAAQSSTTTSPASSTTTSPSSTVAP